MLQASGQPRVAAGEDGNSGPPGVQRGVKVLASEQSSAPHDPKTWDIMCGKTQFRRR